MDQRRPRVACMPRRLGKGCGGGAKRKAARLVLQLGCDAKRQLWADPIGAGDHRLVGVGDCGLQFFGRQGGKRSEEHTSELQSLMRISYAVFCLKKKNYIDTIYST